MTWLDIIIQIFDKIVGPLVRPFRRAFQRRAALKELIAELQANLPLFDEPLGYLMVLKKGFLVGSYYALRPTIMTLPEDLRRRILNVYSEMIALNRVIDEGDKETIPVHESRITALKSEVNASIENIKEQYKI